MCLLERSEAEGQCRWQFGSSPAMVMILHGLKRAELRDYRVGRAGWAWCFWETLLSLQDFVHESGWSSWLRWRRIHERYIELCRRT